MYVSILFFMLKPTDLTCGTIITKNEYKQLKAQISTWCHQKTVLFKLINKTWRDKKSFPPPWYVDFVLIWFTLWANCHPPPYQPILLGVFVKPGGKKRSLMWQDGLHVIPRLELSEFFFWWWVQVGNLFYLIFFYWWILHQYVKLQIFP